MLRCELCGAPLHVPEYRTIEIARPMDVCGECFEKFVVLTKELKSVTLTTADRLDLDSDN